MAAKIVVSRRQQLVRLLSAIVVNGPQEKTAACDRAAYAANNGDALACCVPCVQFGRARPYEKHERRLSCGLLFVGSSGQLS